MFRLQPNFSHRKGSQEACPGRTQRNGVNMGQIGGGSGGFGGGTIPTIPYPNFPQWNGNMGTLMNYAVQVIIWFLQIILTGFANILIACFDGITSGTGNLLNAGFSYLEQSWGISASALQPFGVIAPVVAVLVFMAVFLIVSYGLIKIVKIEWREIK